MSNQAPPVGLTPKWVRDLQRAFEILEAMNRYVEARKPIPQAWFDELQEVAGEKSDNAEKVAQEAKASRTSAASQD